MAVVAYSSTSITNSDTTPQTNNKNIISRGRAYEDVCTKELASGDSIGSTIRCARIRSSDRISRLLLSCDAITTCAADIGIYDVTSVNSGAVIDVDFFASAQSLAAALVNSDVTHEADAADAGAGFGLADVEKPIWQALGLTADPGKWYDVVITLTAAAGSAGTVALKTQYASGN